MKFYHGKNIGVFSVKDTDASNYGVPSPPHSLSISAHSATYVTISWQPPEYRYFLLKYYLLFFENNSNF